MGILAKAPEWFEKYTPPAAAPVVTIQDIFGSMESRANLEAIANVTASIAYNITGSGGGQYTMCIKDGAAKLLDGIQNPDVTATVSAKDWISITLGKIDGMTALTSGKLKVEGDMGLLGQSAQYFKKYTPPAAEGQEEEREELIKHSVVLSIPQKFSTGPVMGKFLNTLKEKKILANKCPECGRLQLPPREVCAECVVAAPEFVEVGPEGIIV
ncbi:MAG: hypothetical protein GY852_01205, partial [bacterium]|nr:hypothetical protein [bacterium]